MTQAAPAWRPQTGARLRPRIAFLGAGWIGHARMMALADADCAEIVAVADPHAPALARVRERLVSCESCGSLEELLALTPDGVVIATPNAMHASQTVAALGAGAAVFCQKPLGRTLGETRMAIETARRADRLLGVDYSYRHCSGLREIRKSIAAGSLGRVFAADLTFHNAYGPDKPWYYEPALAGGGCLTDLGVHLVDMGLWVLGAARVSQADGTLFANGRVLPPGSRESEDFALARLMLEEGIELRLACSWRAHEGQDARISARFWGTEGSALWENVEGSFYDFRAFRFSGTERQALGGNRGRGETEAWGAGAILDWARRLSEGGGYDRRIESSLEVAGVLDRLYGRGGGRS